MECDSDLSSFQVLEQSFEDTTPLIPLYFILSPGSDVVSDVDKLAVKCGMIKDVSYFNISLGNLAYIFMGIHLYLYLCASMQVFMYVFMPVSDLSISCENISFM